MDLGIFDVFCEFPCRKDFALNEMPQYNLQKHLIDDQSYHLTPTAS